MSWTLFDEIAEVELLQLNVGKCDGQCQRESMPRLIRDLNSETALNLCGECTEEYDDYWKEMWDSYYAAVL